MRLDLFLKKTHLLKRREMARELCDEGMVRVNGAPHSCTAHTTLRTLIEVMRPQICSMASGVAISARVVR